MKHILEDAQIQRPRSSRYAVREALAQALLSGIANSGARANRVIAGPMGEEFTPTDAGRYLDLTCRNVYLRSIIGDSGDVEAA